MYKIVSHSITNSHFPFFPFKIKYPDKMGMTFEISLYNATRNVIGKKTAINKTRLRTVPCLFIEKKSI